MHKLLRGASLVQRSWLGCWLWSEGPLSVLQLAVQATVVLCGNGISHV
jgi:hypothetical protein